MDWSHNPNKWLLFSSNLQNCTNQISIDLFSVELSLVPQERSFVLYLFSTNTASPKKMATKVNALNVILHCRSIIH